MTMQGQPSPFRHVRRVLRLRVSDKLGRALTERELAYLSRAVFRQRMDKPDDSPDLAARLDPLISVARMNAKQTVTKTANPPITKESPRDASTSGGAT